MKYMVDIDGTICNNTFGDYEHAQPFLDRIHYFNSLHDDGHEIHYWTARGSNSKLNWTLLTHDQLHKWKVKYTSVSLGKPTYDVFIDDKAFNANTYLYKK